MPTSRTTGQAIAHNHLGFAEAKIRTVVGRDIDLAIEEAITKGEKWGRENASECPNCKGMRQILHVCLNCNSPADVRPIADKIRREERERCATAIPTNWLDPLLSGPDKVLHGEFDCRDIERLLSGLRDRIRALGENEQKEREEESRGR